MSKAFIVKEFNSQKDVTKEDLDLINKYTKRDLSKDEVYIFSIVLCNNEIDRDYEKFTKDSLEKLSKLFLGKTGVMDHDAKALNQAARIFYCEVERLDGKFTKDKEPYFRLKAKAYMPRTEQNKDLILQIDSGIKKEVSVGCAVNKIICSVCGCNLKNGISCNHLKGKSYSGRLCYTILDDAYDAYEWSFVAIPAQREAGVIKTMKKNILKGGVLTLNDILNRIKSLEEINLSKEEVKLLSEYIFKLESFANLGKSLEEDLKKEVAKLCIFNQPKIDTEIIKSVVEKMDFKELNAFKKAFSYKNDNSKFLSLKPQLASKDSLKVEQNTEFKI